MREVPLYPVPTVLILIEPRPHALKCGRVSKSPRLRCLNCSVSGLQEHIRGQGYDSLKPLTATSTHRCYPEPSDPQRQNIKNLVTFVTGKGIGVSTPGAPSEKRAVGVPETATPHRRVGEGGIFL